MRFKGTLQVDAAWKAAEGGVTTVIASGKGGDCILQTVAGGQTSHFVHYPLPVIL